MLNGDEKISRGMGRQYLPGPASGEATFVTYGIKMGLPTVSSARRWVTKCCGADNARVGSFARAEMLNVKTTIQEYEIVWLTAHCDGSLNQCTVRMLYRIPCRHEA